MKGVSTIIASILLVVITIGLVATAYLYFSSIVTVGPVVTVASAYCNTTNHILFTIRNDGTSALNTTTITWLKDGASQTDVNCEPQSVDAGHTTTCVLSGTDNAVNNILAIGPKNQAGGPVNC